MKINIMTPDSTKPNLAAMKISAWHRQNGDEVFSNFPLINADFTYASVLFSWTPDPIADVIGGSKYPHSKLDPEIESMLPDYELYPGIDFSLGYTYRACPRTCDFCIVPKQQNDEQHHSIFSFHNPKFKKICLLNNNTLADPSWRETFDEIRDVGLTLKLEQGLDARFITEEVAEYVSRVKMEDALYVAWDFPEHETEILTGICNLQKAGIKNIRCYVYITSESHKENLDRVNMLYAMKVDPFAMPQNKHDRYQKSFARWVNHKAIFKTVRWTDYQSV